ncbi:MAG: acylphosphatase [Chloroflexi bacterium]|nr:acylphosphatase [Chloroflexota bacterium]
MIMKQIEATVYGFVQGVSFRYYTQREANRLGLTGWVANQANGTVFVVAQGQDPQLQQLIAYLHHGPSYARVEKVKIAWGAPSKNFAKFEIRRI